MFTPVQRQHAYTVTLTTEGVLMFHIVGAFMHNYLKSRTPLGLDVQHSSCQTAEHSTALVPHNKGRTHHPTASETFDFCIWDQVDDSFNNETVQSDDRMTVELERDLRKVVMS
jgi:hypothetical protein